MVRFHVALIVVSIALINSCVIPQRLSSSEKSEVIQIVKSKSIDVFHNSTIGDVLAKASDGYIEWTVSKISSQMPYTISCRLTITAPTHEGYQTGDYGIFFSYNKTDDCIICDQIWDFNANRIYNDQSIIRFHLETFYKIFVNKNRS